MSQARIAIAGATGNVGRELVRLLEESHFSKGTPIFLASSVSAEEIVVFKESQGEVQKLEDFDFKNIDLMFFATPKEVAENYIPKALEAGVRVVDMSAYSASQTDVPLIVPEVNGETLLKAAQQVATPHVFGVQLAMVLNALQSKSSIKQVISTGLVAASGAGRYAMDELFGQTANLLGGAGAEVVEPMEFHQQIAFNCLPHVGRFEDGASNTSVEMAAVMDANRVLGSQIPVTLTAVYVPTFIGASQSMSVEFNSPVAAEEARKALEEAEGVQVIDNVGMNEYSTPFGAAETDYVYVSRVRNDILNPNMLHLWVVTDNLRKGSALNALQVAQKLF